MTRCFSVDWLEFLSGAALAVIVLCLGLSMWCLLSSPRQPSYWELKQDVGALEAENALLREELEFHRDLFMGMGQER